MYFSIFYKKLKINWVLCEFYGTDVPNIVENILKKTENTAVLSYGNLLCKSKYDLEIIYKILTEEYIKIQKQKEKEFNNLPNLLLESTKLLSISSKE